MPAAREYPIMPVAFTRIAEMRGEPAFRQHLVGIAADPDLFADLEHVMLVQHQPFRAIVDRATIFNGLPVVFASGFETSQPKQAISRRVKHQATEPFHQGRVRDCDRTVVDQPRIGKAG